MQSFDVDGLLFKFRYPLLILLSGLIFGGVGVIYFRGGIGFPQTKVEVLSNSSENSSAGNITAEISGAVISSGVYKLPAGSRVEDLLVLGGGVSGDADRIWMEKYLNRAAKLVDGQKIYILRVNEQSGIMSAKTGGGDQTISSTFSSDSSGLININSASLRELDSLPGIGQVYGQSIVEHRPYSNVEELLSKGVLKASVYEKIKNLVTVY